MLTKEAATTELNRLLERPWAGPHDDRTFLAFIADTRTVASAVAGQKSHYMASVNEAVKYYETYQARDGTRPYNRLLGIIESLKHAVEHGLLANVLEETRAGVESDFLTYSDWLLRENHAASVTAAAALAGGVLETHIRNLCAKHGVSTEILKHNGDIERKKVSRLNADLKKAGGLRVARRGQRSDVV